MMLDYLDLQMNGGIVRMGGWSDGWSQSIKMC